MIALEVKMFIDRYNDMCSRVVNDSSYPILTTRVEAYNTSQSFIDFVEGTYVYGACERGNCSTIFEGKDWYECMYYPIEFALKMVGYDYAARNETKVDPRIIAFKYVVEKLKSLDDIWADKFKVKAEIILRNSNIDFSKY
jgi:hypothetical protein